MFKTMGRIHLLVLTILIFATWTWVFLFQFYQKTSFLDDAFIYLNIAKNILDSGTAQFFQVSGNSSLLASSPLRLLILIPSTLVARLFTNVDVSLETARLTFYFSGILSSLMFVPLFRNKLKIWCYGFIFAGLLSLSTQTALQMEGLLLFWLGFSLLMLLSNYSIFNLILLRKVGYLVGLLCLTRPEYGLIAFLILLGIVIYQRSFSLFRAYIVPIVICGVCWIALAFLLHVWPIPTTYLTKMITAELNKFGPNFMFTFPFQFNNYFLKDFHVNAFLIIALLVAYVLVISWKNLFYRLVMGFIVARIFHKIYIPLFHVWAYEHF